MDNKTLENMETALKRACYCDRTHYDNNKTAYEIIDMIFTELTKLQAKNKQLKKVLKDIANNSPWMPTAINIASEVCPHCEKFIIWATRALAESEEK